MNYLFSNNFGSAYKFVLYRPRCLLNVLANHCETFALLKVTLLALTWWVRGRAGGGGRVFCGPAFRIPLVFSKIKTKNPEFALIDFNFPKFRKIFRKIFAKILMMKKIPCYCLINIREFFGEQIKNVC